MKTLLLTVVVAVGSSWGLSACSAAPDEERAATQADDLVKASSVDNPREIRTSATHVFWTTDAGLFAMEKTSDGGSSGLWWPWSWWTTSSSPKPEKILSGAVGAGAFRKSSFVVDGEDVFAVVNGAIVRGSLSGTTPVAYGFPLPDAAEQLVVDDAHVFVTGGKTVFRLPRDFDAAPVVLSTIACPGTSYGLYRPQLDAQAIFVRACHTDLLRIPKTGGASSTLIANERIGDFVLEGGSLTVLARAPSASRSTLFTMPSSGGPRTVLEDNLPGASMAAGGGKVLLWSASMFKRYDVAQEELVDVEPPSSEVLNDVTIDGNGTDYWYAQGNRVLSGWSPGPGDPVSNSGRIGVEPIP